jgi:hypothetical protein
MELENGTENYASSCISGGLQNSLTPAMKLTPEIIATELAKGAITVRAEDRAAIGAAREALARSLGQAETLIKTRRSTYEQEWWVFWAGTGGVLIGALFALVGVASWG